MKLGDGWLRGAEPREGGELEIVWEIKLTFHADIVDEMSEDRELDHQYDAICRALGRITKRDGLVKVEINDDPEKCWL